MKLTKYVALGLMGAACSLNALEFAFTPPDTDLEDLDHYYAYEWGIDWTVPGGQQIVGAQLEIANVRDWTREEDALYLHLLDTAASGYTRVRDSQAGGDNFAGTPWIATYTYDDALFPQTENVVFQFGDSLVETLNAYISDGNIGLGLDPDCHYYNDGITLKITTEHVPDIGSTALQLGGGLLALVGLRRRLQS